MECDNLNKAQALKPVPFIILVAQVVQYIELSERNSHLLDSSSLC